MARLDQEGDRMDDVNDSTKTVETVEFQPFRFKGVLEFVTKYTREELEKMAEFKREFLAFMERRPSVVQHCKTHGDTEFVEFEFNGFKGFLCEKCLTLLQQELLNRRAIAMREAGNVVEDVTLSYDRIEDKR